MTAFDIQLFGAIEIRRNGELLTGFRSQKALVLLTYLLCEERTMTREYLAGLGWPESDQSQALGLLRRSLFAHRPRHVRRRLAPLNGQARLWSLLR